MSALITKLDTQKHKFILMSLLLDISKNNILKKSLVFKWWTALFLLYKLDRFSTDLDFDLIWNESYEKILNELKKILAKYWNIKDYHIKKNTIFLMLSYWEIDHNIKIEVSTRWVSWEYQLKNFMWIKLNIINIDYITANKFIALTTRTKIANRDIFDVHFILKNNLEINKNHIEEKIWKSFDEYIKYMIFFLEKLWNNYNILDWLGSTLDNKQKVFVKNNLIWETIFLLHSLI